MLKWIKDNLLKRGQHIGMDEILQIRIFYANLIFLILVILTVLVLVAQGSKMDSEIMVRTLVGLSIPLISYIIVATGFNKFGRLFFVVVFPAYLTIAIYLGNFQLMQLGQDLDYMRVLNTKFTIVTLLVGVIVIIDSKREKPLFYIGLFWILGLYVFFDQLQNLFFGFDLTDHYSSITSGQSFNTIFSVKTIFIVLELIVLAMINHKQEALISEKNVLLESKIRESETRKNELQEQQENLFATVSKTDELISEVVNSGNFQLRIKSENHTGQWRHLADSINTLLHSISEPFHEVNRVVTQLSTGNLKERYSKEAQGEISILAKNLNQSLSGLTMLIAEINEESEKVRSISNISQENVKKVNSQISEISVGLSEISSGADVQMQKITGVSSLISKIQSAAHQVSTQASEINSSSEKGLNNSQHGVELINELDDIIKTTLSFFEKSDQTIKDLSRYSSEISGILNIIKSIASQTNLLALNAAIEAAQAGESGRGFSVIAVEIRELAEQSQDSVKDIENLIQNLQRTSNSTSDFIVEMNEKVQTGEQCTENVKTAFERILAEYHQTRGWSDQISDSSVQQSNYVEEIVDSVEKIVVISQETAAAAEEVATSTSQVSKVMQDHQEISQDMAEVAKELAQKTSNFTLA